MPVHPSKTAAPMGGSYEMPTSPNTYIEGTFFAVIFDASGAKEGIMYADNLVRLEEELLPVTEDSDLEYIILQVIRNPRNRALH